MKPGSFILTYSDTDSIALAVTQSESTPQNVGLERNLDAIFRPILRDDKHEVCFITKRIKTCVELVLSMGKMVCFGRKLCRRYLVSGQTKSRI